MNLALFDLDNTLLSGDTDVEWLDFLVEQGVLPRSAQQENAEMDRRYRNGEAGTLEYVRFYLRPYPTHDMPTLLDWREGFIKTRITPRIPAAARALVASHRADLVAIITATNRFLTEPIAAELGVEHLIATEPEIIAGRFTGEVAGTPCMREGKITRLEAWLSARGTALADFPESWFYSDSINDLPLLERVTHPVAVDPDPKLAAVAKRRGWRTQSLRDGQRAQARRVQPSGAKK
ncbi:MAG: HAD-IB family hydrolase [Pseudomonadota bacterium]|nr:HAD-IB family hydrolase [Pseudomonadota bacterium]